MAPTSVSNDEQALQTLPPEQWAKHLMVLPARERLEAILRCSDSAAVVAALPEQDFYLSVMELGPDDALPLLAMARVSQLNLLFDLQWWRKDEILPAQALAWVERLNSASQEKLLVWLYHADFELLVSLFSKWLRVAVVPEDVDLLEVLDEFPPHTLDDQYFWEACYPQFEALLKSVLGFLFESHYGFYKGLMEQIIWVSGVEMQEEALRFRRGRLEDLAIPDFYDALGIYQPLATDDLSRQGKGTISQHTGIHEAAPGFALALLGGGHLLARTLERIQDPAVRAALQSELAALANKVVVADQLAPEEPDSLRQAVDKVAAMVSLGLDLHTEGDQDMAAIALQEVFLEHLFRLGFAQIARLRGRLQSLCKTGWLGAWPAGIACLDAPWNEAAELLLDKNPKILRFGAEAQRAPHPDLVRSRHDLWLVKQMVDTIVALGSLYGGLGADAHRLQNELWPDGQIRLLEDVTLGSLLWTAAANQLWRARWEVQPLPVSAWEEVLVHLAPASLEQTIRTWLDQQPIDGAKRNLIAAYLQPLLETYREEITAAGPDGITDPRYVTLFLFSAVSKGSELN